MSFDRASSIMIVVGSLLFITAAFSPISRIFGIRDAAVRLEIIAAAPNQWLIAQVLFALGSIVTAAGVGLLAARLAAWGPAVYVTTSAVLITVGAILWSWHVYLRAIDPARFTAGEIPFWLFAGYTLLTIAGLAALGVALLGTSLPSWAGWLPIISAALFLLLALVFGDMPPFVYYLITLVVGIVLYRAAAAASAVATAVG
jgi:hypothetical protein